MLTMIYMNGEWLSATRINITELACLLGPQPYAELLIAPITRNVLCRYLPHVRLGVYSIDVCFHAQSSSTFAETML